MINGNKILSTINTACYILPFYDHANYCFRWYILKRRTNYDNLLKVLGYFRTNYKRANEELLRDVMAMKIPNMRHIHFNRRRLTVFIGPYWSGSAIRNPSTGKMTLIINAS